MKKIIIAAMLMPWGGAHAMNETADMLRRCEGVNVTNAENYVLRCARDEKIVAAVSGGVPMFFAADNDGDAHGAFLDSIPDNDDYIYVNVVKNSPDTRFSDQICYRFVTEKDDARDGYYAVEICEYERADYYL